MQDEGQEKKYNFLMRWLHIDAISYLFKLGFAKQQKDHVFPQPHFKLFRPIPKYYNGEDDRFKLFKNILLCYRWQISVGILFTVIYSSLNLLLSQIIKQFMQVMHEQNDAKRYISNVTQKFLIMQMLKMIFGIHMKRVFQELAIKVQSTIAKKLVKKALLLDQQCQKKIPQTEIYQLQNVDLKLINNLFTILYLGVEIPYTIGVAIIWLFSLNILLGFIASYWFIIIFLLQRALDDKMRKCNLTKLKLIDQRSKLNYQFMEKITMARINSSESLIVQKNNDYFLEENHDHMLFYRYSSLYDIAQLLLPIAVVVTSLMFDLNTKQPMKVQQLYLILSMLGICYKPMKEFRTFSIALSDGFHSMRRLTDYFQLPQCTSKSNDLYLKTKAKPAFIAMAKGTKGIIQKNGLHLQLDIKLHIQLQPGDRLVILGRKGHGSTTFLNTIIGQIPIKEGLIRVQGKVSYLSQQNFFLIDTIQQNLAFYNKDYDIQRMMYIYKALNLNNELRLTRGMQQVVQNNKYNQNQLKLLSLARVLCTKADIYIFDNPFTGLNSQTSETIENILRQEQARGAIIVMVQKTMKYMNDHDKVVIMNLATTKQFGIYKEMIKNPRSYIDNFLKQGKKKSQTNVQQEQFRALALQFQYKVRKSITFSSLFVKESQSKLLKQKINTLTKIVANYSNKLTREHYQNIQKKNETNSESLFHHYFLKYLKACQFSQSVYILIIIIAVEVLHIFIHFYIGHEYEHRAKSGLQSMKNLMFYEVILTIGLAGLIYLEGQVSSYIAVITGNKLYEQSLICLSHKPIKWYSKQYALRTADKFNHDYEQIFIAVHSILTLYKNLIIVIITAFLLGGNQKLVILAAVIVALLYFLLFRLFRKARSIIVQYFYYYKYQYVKVFNESVNGAELIKIYDVGYQVIEKAKEKYLLLASHKLAAQYILYSQSLLCDFTSALITAVALQLGTTANIKDSQLAVVATSILLLLNLADVIKSIIQTAVQIQSFFKLNLLPFMQIVPVQYHLRPFQYPEQPNRYDIHFDSCYLKDDEDDDIFEIYPLKLKINQGEKVCIYQPDETLRYNLLYSMTKNLTILYDRSNIQRTVFIGGTPICNISSATLRSLIGVITYENFFLTGTLRDNLKWSNKIFDEKQALMIANDIQLSVELKKFHDQGLDIKIQQGSQNFSLTLIKKISVLKILINKPKIVILHDTSPFIWKHQIVKLIEKYIPKCTIIKITNFLDVAYDMQRIIYMQKLNIIQDGMRSRMLNDRFSKVGEILRNTDEIAYKYRNKVQVMPHSRTKMDQLKKSKYNKMLTSSKPM